MNLPAYCDPNNEFRGSRYEETKDLSLKEVAKLIRSDIKEMISAGALPKGIKISVRVRDYTVIDVNITALPDGFRVFNPDYVAATKNFSQPASYIDAHTPEYQRIKDALDANISNYNRDNSDSMIDYFDRRFYGGRTEIHWELMKEISERESVNLEG